MRENMAIASTGIKSGHGIAKRASVGTANRAKQIDRIALPRAATDRDGRTRRRGGGGLVRRKSDSAASARPVSANVDRDRRSKPGVAAGGPTMRPHVHAGPDQPTSQGRVAAAPAGVAGTAHEPIADEHVVDRRGTEIAGAAAAAGPADAADADRATLPWR